jgi:hypothetical protein
MKKILIFSITTIFIIVMILIYLSVRLETIDTDTKHDWLQKNEIKSKWLEKILFPGRLLSPGMPYSINVLADSERKEQLLRFELRNNDYWTDIIRNKTFRSEIDTKDQPPVRSEKWYRFNILLPGDFPIENNRLVVAQWHGADKWWLGEHNRSPVLSFRFINGIFSIKLMHSSKRIIWDVEEIPSEKLFKTKDFALDKWHDFVIEAKWTYEDDGFINIWWNNEQIVHYKGPVGYNDNVGPHFQFGLYRDSTSKSYVSYMKNILTGNSANEIAFNNKKTETNIK